MELQASTDQLLLQAKDAAMYNPRPAYEMFRAHLVGDSGLGDAQVDRLTRSGAALACDMSMWARMRRDMMTLQHSAAHQGVLMNLCSRGITVYGS
jgi:hypothetical protein